MPQAKRAVALVALLFPCAVLSGCTLETTAPAGPVEGVAIHGIVHGGQQPVVGAHVYLMAATVSGVGSAGYGLASTSLLTGTGHTDAVGGYVLSDSYGNFSLDKTSGVYYTCPSATTQVYLYTLGGGNNDGPSNPVSGFMAALGSCGNLTAATLTYVNEVTTVAAAYALAGFAIDALHVSIPLYANAAAQTATTVDTLAQTGLQNAFANAKNLANESTGAALATTPAGNGTVPQATIYTLANILAACINTSGAITGPTSPSNCYTLLYNAESNGSTGTVPTDTATAAINIAHNPGANITALYGLASGTPPFGSGLSAQPNDFALGINFTGGGLSFTAGIYGSKIAIDSSGNAWVVDHGTNAISEFSSLGAPGSSNGYTGGGLKTPTSIGIDGSGYIWVTTNVGLSKFTSAGSPVAASPYTGGGYGEPTWLAIDGSGDVWVTYSGIVDKLSSTGSVLAETDGGYYVGLSYSGPIAIDGSGDAWVTFQGQNSYSSLGKLTSAGSYVSGVNGSQGGGLDDPEGIAMDGSGNSWIVNFNSTISEFANSGLAVSSSSGDKTFVGSSYAAPAALAVDGAGNIWLASNVSSNFSVYELSNSASLLSPNGYSGGSLNSPTGIAVDGSGDVWVTNLGSNSLTEFIGVAVPVITPICAGLPSTATSNGTSNLGTRP